MSVLKAVHQFSVLLLIAFKCISAFELSVLHTNDLHSRFDVVTATGANNCKAGCFGGVARIKYAVDSIRKSHSNTVFLNAGDLFQGTVWYSMFKWRVVANLTSSLGYTASSLGNHEFDDGVNDLEAFTSTIQDSYPMLACNLDVSRVPLLQGKIQPYIIRDVGGEKVAIIGYVTPDTKELSDTGDVIFLDEASSLERAVEEVQSQGVNIVIAVGHSGYEKDLEIAKEVKGLDVIVGGHTNTFLWEGPRPSYVKQLPIGGYPTVITQSSGDKVLVVQTNGYGIYLGKLDVTFNSQGLVTHWRGNPILLNEKHPMDPELAYLVENYREEVDAKMDTVVGSTVAYIDGGRPKCRLEECSFGNFVTDAMAAEMKVEMALINSGAIKGSFDPTSHHGAITLRDIYTAMPWSNTIDVVTISGSTLKKVLEHSVSQYDPNDIDPGGRFLQVSGLIVGYDIRKPVGRRLLSVHVGQPSRKSTWKPLEEEDLYQVAVPSFLAMGGDRFQMIPDSMVEYKNTGFLDNDLIGNYLKKNSPLQLPQAGRIVVVTEKLAVAASGATKHVEVVLFLVFNALALSILIH